MSTENLLGVCEVYDVSARQNLDIVERVELPAEEVVQQNSGVIRRAGIHENDRRR